MPNFDHLRATYLGFWEQLRQSADTDQDAVASAEAFGHLDRNQDGFIDNEELLRNVEEFFFEEDESAPGNWLVGPL